VILLISLLNTENVWQEFIDVKVCNPSKKTDSTILEK